MSAYVMNLYQNLSFKIQKLLHFVWFVYHTLAMGAPPLDLAPSTEPYHFSNLAGAYADRPMC